MDQQGDNMKHILFFAFICIILASCEEVVSSDKLTKNNPSGITVTNETKIVLHSQIVETIDISNLYTWLSTNKNIVIDTMTTIVRGNGYCAGYIVVYHTVDIPKQPEMSPREKALEKLTPTDREALNLK